LGGVNSVANWRNLRTVKGEFFLERYRRVGRGRPEGEKEGSESRGTRCGRGCGNLLLVGQIDTNLGGEAGIREEVEIENRCKWRCYEKNVECQDEKLVEELIGGARSHWGETNSPAKQSSLRLGSSIANQKEKTRKLTKAPY